LLKETNSPISAAIVGAFLTLIMQSSSATVAMTIVFAKNGLLSAYNSIAIMIGAELGTCSDTLIATIRGSRQAIKTGLFHLSFNLASIFFGLLFFDPFVQLVLWFGQNGAIQNTIANAHLIFNIGGVLLFVWTIPLFEKGLNYLLPEKKDPLVNY
jgi:phosphate:Na+ symporter